MKSVVHAIRNHLAVAIANVEAFRDGVLEPSPARLGAVLRALGEIDVLLRDLPRGVPASDVVADEALAFEASAREKGLGFRVVRGGRPFSGDPVRGAEVVNAVIATAIRYTPAGGSIEVDCTPADAFLDVTVDRVLEPAGPSAGLGLSLVRQVVEAHGGTIDVAGGDEGTRLTVRLA